MMKKSKIILSAALLSITIGGSTFVNAQTTLENENELSIAVGSIKAKKYFWTDSSIEGKVFNTKYSTVGLLINDMLQSKVAVNKDGIFKFSTRGLGLISSEKNFEIVGIDEDGQFGERVNYKVYPKLNKDYKMTVSSYKLGEDRIYGTNEAGIDTVALRINNKVVRKVTTVLGENGEESYSLFAKDKVLKKKDKVEIIGYDSSGNTRTVLSVKVTN
ncbi:immunoglobulin-like domain-containing protein [Enterococcus hirae]|uniref:immunoglobulin-like domain-containing protein n=1 Tax=Enterococcus hirae TaxID=1354 RepID=UPI0035DD3667